MAKPNFRMVTVHKSQQISPSFQRLWLTGSSLADFPEDSNGGYIKLLFNDEGKAIQSAEALQDITGRPTMRTYTVRHFEPGEQMMIVDFVRHEQDGHSGPAAHWAMTAQLGESILMGGPGPAARLNLAADWFLLAADMSALPALCTNLEAMPADAQGVAVIEVAQVEDQLTLTLPDGIDVHWVINPNANEPNTVLADAVKSVAWRDGQVAAWAACEFSNMRLIRRYLKNERQLDRDSMYVSSYWKMGITEEQHKVVKQQDSQEAG
jgi:NADPH-dependent ferric siderophore reductase